MTKFHKESDGTWNEVSEQAGFDVTCVIGHVLINPYGDVDGVSPVMAAFQLIADHDTEGRFSFQYHGMTQHITIEREVHDC